MNEPRNTWVAILLLILFGGALLVWWKPNEQQETPRPISFAAQLPTQYISGHNWPPSITTQLDAQLNCQPTAAESSLPERVQLKTIHGTEFCVSANSGAAAGSTYTDYQYSFIMNGKLTVLSFTLRYPNCGNYPDGEQKACQEERQNFNLDELIYEAIK